MSGQVPAFEKEIMCFLLHCILTILVVVLLTLTEVWIHSTENSFIVGVEQKQTTRQKETARKEGRQTAGWW